MKVTLPANNSLFVHKETGEVHLVVTSGVKVFDKDTELMIIKKLNDYKNQQLEAIPTTKFENDFKPLIGEEE